MKHINYQPTKMDVSGQGLKTLKYKTSKMLKNFLIHNLVLFGRTANVDNRFVKDNVFLFFIVLTPFIKKYDSQN